MNPDDCFAIREQPELRIECMPILTPNAGGPLLVFPPGHAHLGTKHFLPLAQELVRQGVSSALLNYWVDHGNVMSRNLVTLDTHRSGTRKIIPLIEEETQRKVSGIVGHSQGALIGQELLQELDEEGGLNEKFVSIFLAPIPSGGVKNAVLKLAIRHPKTFAKVVLSYFTKNGMAGLSDKEIRLLFFDKNTPKGIVSETRETLTSSSFRVFLEDTFRQWTRPKIRPTKRPTLLIRSNTDWLFSRDQYNDFEETYSDLETIEIAGGGHDFFIQYADKVAEHIVRYLIDKGLLRPETVSLSE